MGVSFSYPFSNPSDDENGMKSIIVKSISFGNDDDKTPFRSVSFNSHNSEPMVMKSLDSGAMKIEGSISFERRDLETVLSFKAPLEQEVSVKQIDSHSPRSPRFSILDPNSPKHEAALKLQKVYKSFRTRRKLADCAVLVEQSWWKLLDFAELKRSSISFFDIEKHETAISRWSRARTRAAKVGKGLSKNDKAQKLALQHWLEAIDPRHRYGHNLHFYYGKWLHCQSREPFFYWLDIGEGREVNLVEKCPRLKLQQQCIKYLGPLERKVYEVIVDDGKFFYKQTGELLHTTTGAFKDAKWIFVLSTSKILYVGRKKKGTFQHSSFLSGGATTAAGRLVVDNGILKAVWPHSGHYRPTEQNFKDFVSFLKENDVDLTDVKMSPVEEEEDVLSEQRSSNHLRNNSSEEDLILQLNVSETEDLTQEHIDASKHLPSGTKLTCLEIPTRNDLFDTQNRASGPIGDNVSAEGYESSREAFTSEHEEAIPKTSILQRINSRKGINSYQLGKQLSCRWTTGAGPRIGCVRDYPAELQLRALEQVCLSPRSARLSGSSPILSESATTIMRSSSVPEKGILARRSIPYSCSWKQSSTTNVSMIDDSISL